MIQEQAARAAAKNQGEVSGPANEFKRGEKDKLEFNVSLNKKKTNTPTPVTSAFGIEEKKNLAKKNKYDHKISEIKRCLW